jgi:hypothetical protein
MVCAIIPLSNCPWARRGGRLVQKVQRRGGARRPRARRSPRGEPKPQAEASASGIRASVRAGRAEAGGKASDPEIRASVGAGRAEAGGKASDPEIRASVGAGRAEAGGKASDPEIRASVSEPRRACGRGRRTSADGPFSAANSQAAQKGPDARRRPTAAREAYFLYVERAAEGAVPPQMGLFQQPTRRLLKKVQMRGGARRPHARRTSCTLSVRPRAPYLRRWALFSSQLAGCSKRSRCEAAPDGRTRGVLPVR